MAFAASAARRDFRAPTRSAFEEDVLRGLTAPRKHLSPKYFYDARGCELFESITEQPEYYPTRVELEILRDNAVAITSLFPADAALVEFGTGATTKARILLEAAKTLKAYVPIDIASEWLNEEASRVQADFPHLVVHPVIADFTSMITLPAEIRSVPRVGFFPGSTIGNFEPHEASGFLQRAATVLGAGAMLIVGVDRVKDTKILNAAYNDATGVTAAFNLNLLTRINREIGADFDVKAFEHHAFFNRPLSRVEMHLASRTRQRVRIDGETILFRPGETIHTESSYKYTPDSFAALARGAGWKSIALWSDSAGYFSVHALALR
jgi:dimethylhistidine N-methyltransferase